MSQTFPEVGMEWVRHHRGGDLRVPPGMRFVWEEEEKKRKRRKRKKKKRRKRKAPSSLRFTMLRSLISNTCCVLSLEWHLLILTISPSRR